MGNVYRPLNLAEALRVRASASALVLAGGTDFMIRRGRFSQDRRPVLYVGHLGELSGIALWEDALHIGAACTLSALLESPLLPDYLKPPLAQMASPAIRNVATIGGNICNASPAGDALPMLYALDAEVCLRSEAREEWMAVSDFILGPGRTRLDGAQLLTEIRVPLQGNWRCTYRKVGPRRANSLSKLSFYAVADGPAGRPRDIRIAFGAVAPTVVRSREAELEILSGARPEPQRIIARYDALLQPIDDARSSRAYRRAVAQRLLAQYLTEEMSE